METYTAIKPRMNSSPLAESPQSLIIAGDLGGTVLIPGIYKATEAVRIQEGDLTLDAKGNENAVWIFQLASDFSTMGGSGGNVILTGNAKAENVFWQTEHLASIGEGTSFKGNILAKMDQEELGNEAQPVKEDKSEMANFKKRSKMGWPLYGQQL